jgi:hypothetical protein
MTLFKYLHNIYILELAKDKASKTEMLDVPLRVLCVYFLMNIYNCETVPV